MSKEKIIVLKAAGTEQDPIRYEQIERTDPERETKIKAQWDEAQADAKAGKCICLSDLLCNAGI